MSAVEEWGKSYRSMDAGGEPEAAVPVAWKWIEERADELRALYGPEELEIVNVSHGSGDCGVIALYHRTTLLYAATTFRDPMNATVLIRWVARGPQT